MRFNSTLLIATALLAAPLPQELSADQFGDFEYETAWEGEIQGVRITAYNGADESVDIPSIIDGKSIIAIGEYVFANQDLQSVSIPSSVISIGERAFDGCRSLETVNFPESLERIGHEAFSGVAIRSLVMPASVDQIDDSAFEHCPDLRTLEFSADVSNLGIDIFRDCDGLISVQFPPQFSRIPARMFGYCRILSSVSLSDGMTAIGDGAFEWCANLASIQFPDSLITIGYEAFVGTGFSSLSIPSSVQSLGDRPFAFCENLLQVEVASSNQHYADLDGVLFNKTETSLLCYPAARNASSYDVPDSVETIGLHTFASNDSIQSINIPAATTIISEEAFYANAALKSVSVHTDNSAYASIDGVLFDKEVKTLLYFPYAKQIDVYQIPPGVETITERAFYFVGGIRFIVIPEGVTEIQDSAFSGSSITGAVIPASVNLIARYAFYTRDLLSVYFLGDAPSVPAQGFYRAPNGDSYATVYIFDSAQGFGTDVWNYRNPYSLPLVRIGESNSQFLWKIHHGLSHDIDLSTDPMQLGFPLFLPYALNLPPDQQLKNSWEMTGETVTWSFYGGRTDVEYTVETISSLDPYSWSVEGVLISEPDSDGFRTATIEITDETLIGRIKVSSD